MIIGLDFSINKPAACIYDGKSYQFISWPFGLSKRLIDIYKGSGVKIIDRDDEKYKGKDSSEKMRWEVNNSIYLSNLIISSLPENLSDYKIVFEGISYASSGNMAIQLGGYKYILMKSFFDENVPFSNMTTYAPITIKKTAGASKKGMGKKEMIDSFINSGINSDLKHSIENDPEMFKKKTGNWIDHLDDLVDSFWAVQTILSK
jgi:hypothetical protein